MNEHDGDNKLIFKRKLLHANDENTKNVGMRSYKRASVVALTVNIVNELEHTFITNCN